MPATIHEGTDEKPKVGLAVLVAALVATVPATCTRA